MAAPAFRSTSQVNFDLPPLHAMVLPYARPCLLRASMRRVVVLLTWVCREERPADNTKSWRRGPPGVMPAEPVVRGASSSLGHSATRPAIGKEKDQQRKPPRPRDRGRDEPEDKKKKDGSSRRSVAPPPGFASAGEQKVRTRSWAQIWSCTDS